MSDFRGSEERMAEYKAMCFEDSYVRARSACIQFGMDELERSVVSGVESGTAGLGPTEKANIANELLRRLFGKTHEELVEEQRQDLALEDARLVQMFSHE